jgi:hypothetical protein
VPAVVTVAGVVVEVTFAVVEVVVLEQEVNTKAGAIDATSRKLNPTPTNKFLFFILSP